MRVALAGCRMPGLATINIKPSAASTAIFSTRVRDRSYIGVENSKIYAAQSKARFIELFKSKNPADFV